MAGSYEKAVSDILRGYMGREEEVAKRAKKHQEKYDPDMKDEPGIEEEGYFDMLKPIKKKAFEKADLDPTTEQALDIILPDSPIDLATSLVSTGKKGVSSVLRKMVDKNQYKKAPFLKEEKANPVDETMAAWQYTGPDYTKVRDAFHNPKLAKKDDKLIEFLNNLDSATKNNKQFELKRPTELLRFDEAPPGGKYATEVKVGQELVTERPHSFTKDAMKMSGYISDDVAEGSMFPGGAFSEAGRIYRVKNATHGADISKVSALKKEAEVLVPEGVTYKVTGIEKDQYGRDIIDLEEMSPKELQFKRARQQFPIDRYNELVRKHKEGKLSYKEQDDLRKASRELRRQPSEVIKEITAKSPDVNQQVLEVANTYMKDKGLKGKRVQFSKVNPEFGAKVAKAYDAMEHNPNDPRVKEAYDALINETMDQFEAIKKAGLKVSRIEPGMENPYRTSKDLHKDIKENNHMWYYPTEQGFGSRDADAAQHPMLKATGVKDGDKELLANDVFRIVHDYFGHVKEGTSFGPKGEETAYRIHKQMFSPKAQKALATETRGQNSWVNFGPYGAQNRADPKNTTYADQKAGLLPDWALEDYED